MKVLSTEGLTKLITLCKNAFLTREDAEDVYTVDVEGDVTEADTVEVEEVDFLASISGFDETKTQTLKNVNGTFIWTDD